MPRIPSLGLALALALVLQAGLLRGQAADQREQDLSTIRRAAQEFVKAFDRADARAVASHWTSDGEYIDESGHAFRGREAIQEEYARFFAEHPGAKLKLFIDSLRLLSDVAAIEDGRAMLEPAPPGAPAISKYTAVHIKADGKWLMASVRDTRLEIPSNYHRLADLEWLIGAWQAEAHGATSDVVCRWVGNKSFLERRYTVSHQDQPPTSGVQLIGFNPQTGRIQSWNFAADGGHAVGTWTAQDSGWSIETTGMSNDGTPTRSVNILKRLNDDAYVWQSTQRNAGGINLPDTEEVVLKRKVE